MSREVAMDSLTGSRLARPSFFGGTVSTRAACTAPDWKPFVPVTEREKTAKRKDGDKVEKGTAAGKQAKPVEVDPKKQLVQRLKADLAASVDAYANLEDAPVGAAPPQPQGNAPKPKPKSATDELLEAAAKHLMKNSNVNGSASNLGNGQRTPPSFGVSPLLQGGLSRPGFAGKPGARPTNKVKVVPPSRRGKGAAGLATAVMPQAVSKSRKQVATDALRQAIANVRPATPPPTSLTPPMRGLTSARGAAAGPLRASKASSEPPLAAARGGFPSRDSAMGTQVRYPAREPGAFQGTRPAPKPAQGSVPPSRGQARPMGTGISGRAGSGASARPASKQLVGFHSPVRQLTGVRKRGREREYDSEGSFVLSDWEEDDDDGGDWRRELQSITGYNPNKYKNEAYDDRRMVASLADIRKEEARSLRAGREEDARAEAELLAAAAAKAAAKKKAKKKARVSSGDD